MGFDQCMLVLERPVREGEIWAGAKAVRQVCLASSLVPPMGVDYSPDCRERGGTRNPPLLMLLYLAE